MLTPDVRGKRRAWVTKLLAACLLMFASITLNAAEKPIVIGLTPVFLDEQLSFLTRWEDYLERKTGHPVRFVQRQSYREVTELLLNGELDAAWLCGFPYIQHRDKLVPLAVPLFNGEPLYRSYLIVGSTDTATQSIDDLRDRIFAFSDPDSNSGYLVTQAGLRSQGLDANSFFHRSFFTWAHRNVVKAVADGLADGGAVDGYVWEALAKIDPELTSRTRVIQKSEQFGFPPFLTRINSQKNALPLREALISMATDPEGQILLRELQLDGFTLSRPGLYQSIANLAEQL
tara:strand:+ start:1448 stop:2311 length:864 start_codon:yes stop_codon:yes gene_type:complete